LLFYARVDVRNKEEEEKKMNNLIWKIFPSTEMKLNKIHSMLLKLLRKATREQKKQQVKLPKRETSRQIRKNMPQDKRVNNAILK